MIKKKPTKKHAKKKAVKKRAVKKISGVHKDTKSHNVKINVLSGEISKGKQKLIENLKYLYGKFASNLITTTNLKDKKEIIKQLNLIKNEIKRLNK